ncbi:MAG: betaine-aldehyde dehydrogenase, partial [Bacteroidota bacterium]
MATKKQENTPSLDFSGGWEYAPAPENTNHIQLKDRYELFIGGKWVKPTKGKYFETINPANEQKLADIA